MQNVGICNGAAWKPSSDPLPLPSETKNSSKISHFVEMLMAKRHYGGEKKASCNDLGHLDNAETTFLEWILFTLRLLFTGNFLRHVVLLNIYIMKLTSKSEQGTWRPYAPQHHLLLSTASLAFFQWGDAP